MHTRDANAHLQPLTPMPPPIPFVEETATPAKSETQTPAPIDDLRDVHFDERQQKKLDLILKESHGRFGAAQRAEITRLKSEMVRLQNEKDEAAEPLPEVELLRARLAAEQARSQALIEDRVKVDRENLVNRLAQKHDFVKPEIVATLTQANLKWSAATRSFEVVDNDGQPRLDAEFKPLTPDAFMAQFASENPFLVRGRTLAGIGSTSNSQSTLSEGRRGLQCEQVFGRGSNASVANQLALKNPTEYRRLRTEAVRKNLIG